MRSMMSTFPRAGRLEWIGMAPEKRAPLTVVEQAEVRVGTGLEGEHHARSGRGKRQVTLIQREHLEVVRSLTGEAIGPEQLRRNLVVSGINLFALRFARFRVGEVLLEGTGTCAPCSRMEQNIGVGGYNAMRGHGGITARVIEGGTIRLGDEVRFVALPDHAPDTEE